MADKPEFVEAGGRYVPDYSNNTMKTVMRYTDADGCITERVTHCTTFQIFKYWAAQMREAEALIDAHLEPQNVLSMSDYKRHAADAG